MHLGMDGPSVNLKFLEDLKKQPVKNSCMWTPTSYVTYICFLRKDCLFFQLTLASLRWTYVDFSNFVQHAVKIMLTWGTNWSLLALHLWDGSLLKFLLVRVIERWENLKECFWNFLPKQKELKKYVRDTKRYKNIVERLNLAFVVFLVIPFYISVRKAFDSYAIPRNQSTVNQHSEVFC